MKQSHAQGEDCTLVGKTVGYALHLEDLQSLWGIIEVIFIVEVKQIFAETGAHYFADPLLIEYDIRWIESVVHDL